MPCHAPTARTRTYAPVQAANSFRLERRVPSKGFVDLRPTDELPNEPDTEQAEGVADDHRGALGHRRRHCRAKHACCKV